MFSIFLGKDRYALSFLFPLDLFSFRQPPHPIFLTCLLFQLQPLIFPPHPFFSPPQPPRPTLTCLLFPRLYFCPPARVTFIHWKKAFTSTSVLAPPSPPFPSPPEAVTLSMMSRAGNLASKNDRLRNLSPQNTVRNCRENQRIRPNTRHKMRLVRV